MKNIFRGFDVLFFGDFLGLNFHENKIENETICRLHFTMCSNLFEIYQNPPVICANLCVHR